MKRNKIEIIYRYKIISFYKKIEKIIKKIKKI